MHGIVYAIRTGKSRFNYYIIRCATPRKRHHHTLESRSELLGGQK